MLRAPALHDLHGGAPVIAQRCGAYADHVDHVLPRAVAGGSSALRPAGSTRRWRRLRRYVLDRDGWRCQVLVDPAGAVVEAERPASPPAGPDDPTWLRATCPRHNLQRGAALTDARPNRTTPTTRWDW